MVRLFFRLPCFRFYFPSCVSQFLHSTKHWWQCLQGPCFHPLFVCYLWRVLCVTNFIVFNKLLFYHICCYYNVCLVKDIKWTLWTHKVHTTRWIQHAFTLYIPVFVGALRTSNACSIELANEAASSLLPKFSPHTCLGSRHWWKFGVAWLYFIPFTRGQLITTWQEEACVF